ncbi:MAG: hypothetical protein QM725_18005 [Lacibacter sp.]
MKKIAVLVITLISCFNIYAQVIKNTTVPAKINEAKTLVVKPVAFRIHMTNQTLFFTSLKPNVIDMPVKEFDLGGNISGNNFKAFDAGVYHFDATLSINYNIEENQVINRFHLYMYRNGALIGMCSVMNPKTSVTAEHTMSISTTVMLQKGDVINLAYEVDGNQGHDSMTRGIDASFSGFKVQVENQAN